MKQYTLKELQEYMGVSYSTALKLIKKQEVKAELKKGVYLIDADSVEDYLKRKEEKKNRKSLTTAVNPEVYKQIKRQAIDKGLTVSAFLETYMELIAKGEQQEDLAGDNLCRTFLKKYFNNDEKVETLETYVRNNRVSLVNAFYHALLIYISELDVNMVMREVEASMQAFNPDIRMQRANNIINFEMYNIAYNTEIGTFSFNRSFKDREEIKNAITAKALKTLAENIEQGEK